MRYLYSFNRLTEKYMFLVTPVCLLIGISFPEQTGRLIVYVPYVFAFMTFSGSLKSCFRDVACVFRRPIPLAATLFMLHFLLPLLTRAAGGLFFSQHPYLITGMVLEFVVPSAVVSVMWVSIYRGSGPFTLSVVLMDTLLAPVLVPFSLKLFVGSSVRMDALGMMRELVLMIAVPALLALTLNQTTKGKYQEALSRRLAPFGKMALMFVVCANSSKVAPFVREMTPLLFEVTAVMFCIASLGFVLGWLGAALLRQNREYAVSMMFNTGMRNISAGAVIAAAYFPPAVIFPVMICDLFQQVLAAVFAKLFAEKDETGGESEEEGGK